MTGYCKTCAFWQEISGRHQDTTQKYTVGECRRYPRAHNARWPEMNETEWCGEYRGQSDVRITLDRGTPASMQSKASTERHQLVKEVCAAIEQHAKLWAKPWPKE